MASNMLWNGLIQFYSDNFMLFCVVSFIESNDFRFRQNYTRAEIFCSCLAAIGIFLAFSFPLFTLCLYLKKLKWIDPTYDKENKIKSLLERYLNVKDKQHKH